MRKLGRDRRLRIEDVIALDYEPLVLIGTSCDVPATTAPGGNPPLAMRRFSRRRFVTRENVTIVHYDRFAAPRGTSKAALYQSKDNAALRWFIIRVRNRLISKNESDRVVKPQWLVKQRIGEFASILVLEWKKPAIAFFRAENI